MRALLLTLSVSIASAQGDDPLGGVRDPVPKEARAAAMRAVEWLVRAQNRDGSFGDNPGSRGEIGNTCIAALALMAHGSTLSCGPYYRNVRKALDWVRRRTQGYAPGRTLLDRATLLQAKLGENQDLYLTALLYSQVLGMNLDADDQDTMRQELRAMTGGIASLQKKSGEWETSYEPMLTTISAWLALRQAHSAGVAIDHASPDKVVEWLRTSCLEKSSGIFREAKWGNQERFVTQAGALRVFYGMGLAQAEDTKKATQVILRMKFDQDVGGRTGGEEFLGALYATQALFLEHGDEHAAWYPKICKALIASQNKDGSWMGHHCITGRVFCTSCALMSFLVPDRLLPMVER